MSTAETNRPVTVKPKNYLARLFVDSTVSFPICITSYLIGLALLFLWPSTHFAVRTSISEHALLPGLVNSHFDDLSLHSRFQSKIHTFHDPPKVYEFMKQQLFRIGIAEVNIQKFTLSNSTSGGNLYAYIRAPRASSVESLVLNFPFHDKSFDSMAFVISIAKFFNSQVYWAKDIIILISQHGQNGVRAFLEAYYRKSYASSHANLKYDDLSGDKGGSIQAAIVVDFNSLVTETSHINIKMLGLNGHLPDMDLFNLVTMLSEREGFQTMVEGRVDPTHEVNAWNLYKHMLQTSTEIMLKQASTLPSGNHGPFLQYGIQSVTLEGVDSGSQYGGSEVSAGRLLESIFRSLNNMLERFHAGIFFYLPSSTQTFVSISYYMPAFVLMNILPSLLYATNIFCNLSMPTDISQNTMYSVIVILFLTHTSSFSVVSATLAAIITSLLYHMKYSRVKETSQFLNNVHMILKFFTILETTLIMYALSLLNFSLAYFTSILITPCSLLCSSIVRSEKNTLFEKLIQISVFLANLFLLTHISSHYCRLESFETVKTCFTHNSLFRPLNSTPSIFLSLILSNSLNIFIINIT